MKNTFLGVILFALIIGCSNKKSPTLNIIETENHLIDSENIDTITILLEEGKYGNSWLEIFDDRKRNTLHLQTRRKGFVLSIAGYGNSELLLNESNHISLDTINSLENNKNEYILSSFIKGSTYGASIIYIVYFNNEWDIFRIPFDNVEINYDKGNHNYEIIRVKANGVRDSFIFDSGILIPASDTKSD